MIKKAITIFIICIFAVCSLAGCKIKSKTDISIRETVTVVGIDEADDIITITITIELIKPSDDNGSGSSVAIYTAQGSSLFDAIQEMHKYTDKIIFWGHVNYIIIGEDTARLGINKYLDLFARDHEIKQNVKVIVAKGTKAEDFIKDTNLKNAPLNQVLSSLFDDSKVLSNDNEVTILQYLQMVSCKKMCLYLPVVTTIDNKEKDEDDEGKKEVFVDGYALFRDDKLAVFLENDKAKGVNWIIDKTHAGYVTIKDKDDDIVVLEVTKNKTSYDVDYSGKVPKVEITIEFHTNIVEYHGDKDIFSSEEIEYLTKEQNKVVKSLVADTIAYLQEEKLDIINITNQIQHKYPKKTQDYDEIWPEVFAQTKITVKVDSSIDRTYNINQPVAHDERKDK